MRVAADSAGIDYIGDSALQQAGNSDTRKGAFDCAAVRDRISPGTSVDDAIRRRVDEAAIVHARARQARLENHPVLLGGNGSEVNKIRADTTETGSIVPGNRGSRIIVD